MLAEEQELVLDDLDPADEGADLEGRGAVERHVRPRHRRHVLGRGLRQRVLTIVLQVQTINRRSFTITEKAPTMAFSWLKAPTSTFTFKTLLRHYAKWALPHGKKM